MFVWYMSCLAAESESSKVSIVENEAHSIFHLRFSAFSRRLAPQNESSHTLILGVSSAL